MMSWTRAIGGIALCGLLAAAAQENAITVTGEVSDSQCAFTVHSNTGSHDELMRSGLFGTTPAECIQACIRLGGKYVLVDHAKKKVYQIANPELVSRYASKQVRTRGTVDGKGILTVQEIEAAKPATDEATKK
jgi:hypothetical protein